MANRFALVCFTEDSYLALSKEMLAATPANKTKANDFIEKTSQPAEPFRGVPADDDARGGPPRIP